MEDKIRLLSRNAVSAVAAYAEPTVARVLERTGDGLVIEIVPGSSGVARMSAEVARIEAAKLIGAEVVVLFEHGQSDRPIAISVLHSDAPKHAAGEETGELSAMRAEVDDDELVLSAKRKIRLHCGKASITITRDGKIILRGTNILSRSSGPLRLKGGHVEIN